MTLRNLKIVGDADPVDIQCADGKIAAVTGSKINSAALAGQLQFDGAMVFPGLINSHDHLNFNLFPQLGDRTYANYTEWGGHIHHHYKKEIDAILKVPAGLRYRWGVYKNLLCGVTTVINHGEPARLTDPLINVFEETHCLHSVKFEKKWRLKLNNPFKNNAPVTIHTGEGVDRVSHAEIDELIKWNLLRKPLIGVHGVAMDEMQAKNFKAMVWCPASNLFLLNKTARIDSLKKYAPILFGTDSTLTGAWSIWDHLRTAKNTRLLTNEQLYRSLNQGPASIWGLNCGEITPGKDADLVVARTNKQKNTLETFFGLSPDDLQLVMCKGLVRFFDAELLPQLQNIQLQNFSKININDRCKYVQGDLPGLMKQIKTYGPDVTFPASILN